MKVTSKINYKALKEIHELAIDALVETADAVKSDLVDSQTMPFDTGALQNRSTFVNDRKKKSGTVSIVSDTPYARRLYFHPEYNFQKSHNSNASAMWFEPYISGKKKNFAKNTFNRILKEKL